MLSLHCCHQALDSRAPSCCRAFIIWGHGVAFVIGGGLPAPPSFASPLSNIERLILLCKPSGSVRDWRVLAMARGGKPKERARRGHSTAYSRAKKTAVIHFFASRSETGCLRICPVPTVLGSMTCSFESCRPHSSHHCHYCRKFFASVRTVLRYICLAPAILAKKRGTHSSYTTLK